MDRNLPTFTFNGVPDNKKGSNCLEEFSSVFGGKVEFDFGNVTNSKFGTTRIKGEFPRIQPRKGLVPISFEDFEYLQKELKNWAIRSWGPTSTRWAELIKISALFIYSNVSPFFAVRSVQFEISLHFTMWIWNFADTLQNRITYGLLWTDIDRAIEQLLAVFDGNRSKIEMPKRFPEFKSFHDSLISIVDEWTALVPNFKSLSGPLKLSVHKYLKSLCWPAIERMDRRYTEETFKFWRRNNGFYDAMVESIFLYHGLELPSNIRQSVTLGRILNIANLSASFANDLFGIQRKLRNRDLDNLVVFKIFEKDIPVGKAVEDVCRLLRAEIADLLLLRNVILQEFSSNSSLVVFLDIVETVVDGFNVVHANSKRDLAAGVIKFTY